MSNLSNLMKEYFEESDDKVIGAPLLIKENRSMPVVPEVITWKIVTDPERFMRRFEFNSRDRLVDFLGEVLELENEMNHNGKLTVDHLHVDIEVYTKSIDCVTELDIEYTHAVSQIYEDVENYGYKSE